MSDLNADDQFMDMVINDLEIKKSRLITKLNQLQQRRYWDEEKPLYKSILVSVKLITNNEFVKLDTIRSQVSMAVPYEKPPFSIKMSAVRAMAYEVEKKIEEVQEKINEELRKC